MLLSDVPIVPGVPRPEFAFKITGKAGGAIPTGSPTGSVDGQVYLVLTGDPTDIAGIPIVGVDTIDGIRYRMEGGQWSVIRFSGTEPLLRIYTEAPTPEQVRELLVATRALTGV